MFLIKGIKIVLFFSQKNINLIKIKLQYRFCSNVIKKNNLSYFNVSRLIPARQELDSFWQFSIKFDFNTLIKSIEFTYKKKSIEFTFYTVIQLTVFKYFIMFNFLKNDLLKHTYLFFRMSMLTSYNTEL